MGFLGRALGKKIISANQTFKEYLQSLGADLLLMPNESGGWVGGTAVDFGVHGFTISNGGAVTLSGGRMVFDATATSILTFSNNATFRAHEQWTWIFDVTLTSLGLNQELHGYSNSFPHVYITAANQLDSQGAYATSASNIRTNEFVTLGIKTIAEQVDGTTTKLAKLYFDAVEQTYAAATAGVGAYQPDDVTTNIGNRSLGDTGLDGSLGVVARIPSLLSDAQILDLHNRIVAYRG